MKKFEKYGKVLSKDEQMKIKGGLVEPPDDGFSCECTDGHSAGMASCDTCEKWCKDSGYGSKKTCD